MSDTPEEATRYVLAECTESGVVRCLGVLPPRAERVKDPFKRRKYHVYYYPRGLSPIYTGDRGGNFSPLLKSPFWRNVRAVKKSEIPEGVSIP